MQKCANIWLNNAEFSISGNSPLLCGTHSSWVLLFLMKSGTASLLSLTVSFQCIVHMIWQLQVHAYPITYMHLWSKLCNIKKQGTFQKEYSRRKGLAEQGKKPTKIDTNILHIKLLHYNKSITRNYENQPEHVLSICGKIKTVEKATQKCVYSWPILYTQI